MEQGITFLILSFVATVAVCGALERSPGYAVIARSLDRFFGKALVPPFRNSPDRISTGDAKNGSRRH